MEVYPVPSVLRNELLEDVEESVQHPGVVHDVTAAEARRDWYLQSYGIMFKYINVENKMELESVVVFLGYPVTYL